MTWTTTVTRATGDLITAAIWNNQVGVSGNSDHVHQWLHVLVESATFHSAGTAGGIWKTASAFLTGKVIPWWNHIQIQPAYFTGIDSNRFQFGTNMTSALNGGTATVSGDLVTVLYAKSE